MKTNLTKGLSKEDAVLFTRQFEESLALRRQLIKVVEEKIRSENSVSLSKDLYDSPNWSHRQADSVGYKRALEEIISLLS